MSSIKLKIDEFTTPSPDTAHIDNNYQELCIIMKDKGFRHIPILNHQKEVVGLVSDRDLRTLKLAEGLESVRAEEIMTPDVFTVSKNQSLEEVVFEMSKQKIGSAIVTEDSGAVYGIFTSTDAMNALVEVLRGEYK